MPVFYRDPEPNDDNPLVADVPPPAPPTKAVPRPEPVTTPPPPVGTRPNPNNPAPTTPPPAAGEGPDPYAAFFPGGTFNGDYQGFFNAVFPGSNLTGAQLKAQTDLLKRAGIEVVTSASGNTGWVRFPGSGGDWDVIGDYGGANTKTWQRPGSGGAGTQQEAAQQVEPFNHPDFEPPSWDYEAFDPPDPFTHPDYQPGADPQYDDFQAPEAFSFPDYEPPPAFAYEDFQAPTPEQAEADPGYAFSRREGQRALENSASAQGLLRSGGTAKALMEYGQGLAGQQYGNVYDRQRADYATNRSNAADIYDRNLKTGLVDNQMAFDRASDTYDRNLTTSRATWEGNRANQQDLYDRTEQNNRFTYDTNRYNAADSYYQNWQNAFAANMSRYNQEANEFNQAATIYGMNFDTAAANYGLTNTATNNRWDQLMSLFDLSQQNMPNAPTRPDPSDYGL